jgi:hypothetical protein
MVNNELEKTGKILVFAWMGLPRDLIVSSINIICKGKDIPLTGREGP